VLHEPVPAQTAFPVCLPPFDNFWPMLPSIHPSMPLCSINPAHLAPGQQPDTTIPAGRQEAELVMAGALAGLLDRTGLVGAGGLACCKLCRLTVHQPR
jgi:hypothetical protein